MIEKLVLQDLLKERSVKAFVFDLDGTLVDSQAGIAKTVSEFLQSKGHDIGKKQIMELFGTPLEKIFCLLIQGFSETEAFEYLKEIRKIYA
ncbi:MAG: hypothetical protein FK734_03885, partial [Asgard group archaeon]|nr:hypothetical protein [Asgard group archaeon]